MCMPKESSLWDGLLGPYHKCKLPRARFYWHFLYGPSNILWVHFYFNILLIWIPHYYLHIRKNLSLLITTNYLLWKSLKLHQFLEVKILVDYIDLKKKKQNKTNHKPRVTISSRDGSTSSNHQRCKNQSSESTYFQ